MELVKKHRIKIIIVMVIIGVIAFFIFSSIRTSNDKKTVLSELDSYQNDITGYITSYIKDYDKEGLLKSSDVTVECKREESSTSNGNKYSNTYINYYVSIAADDSFDSLSFKSQYDYEKSLFEALQKAVREKTKETDLFGNWLRGDGSDRYCKAFNVTMNFNDFTYEEFKLHTSKHRYEVSDIVTEDYFRIDGKEYVGVSFKSAYGTATNYDLLTTGEKKEICKYIQDQYDYYDKKEGKNTGDKYSDDIWKDVAEKWGISEIEVSIIWQNYSY